jgi:hypothetical protein
MPAKAKLDSRTLRTVANWLINERKSRRYDSPTLNQWESIWAFRLKVEARAIHRKKKAGKR